MRTHLLERSQRVEVPIDQAFAFYGDERNLEPLTPPWLHFEVTTQRPIVMAAGTLLEYRLKLHGIPIRWRTRIDTWEPPSRFTDFQEKGPYSLWEHTHTFEKDGEGSTVIRDQVRYSIPGARSARSLTGSSSAATSSGSSTSAATPSPSASGA